MKKLRDMGDIKERIIPLTSWLYDQLSKMKPIIIYSMKGGDTVTFNIMKDGKIINPKLFETQASHAQICVRADCFCNPGVNEKIYKDREEEMLGAIRASFGFANNFSDVKRIVEFTKNFISTL